METEIEETERQRQEAGEETEKESQMRRETGLQKRWEIEKRGDMKSFEIEIPRRDGRKISKVVGDRKTEEIEKKESAKTGESEENLG